MYFREWNIFPYPRRSSIMHFAKLNHHHPGLSEVALFPSCRLNDHRHGGAAIICAIYRWRSQAFLDFLTPCKYRTHATYLYYCFFIGQPPPFSVWTSFMEWPILIRPAAHVVSSVLPWRVCKNWLRSITNRCLLCPKSSTSSHPLYFISPISLSVIYNISVWATFCLGASANIIISSLRCSEE